MKDIKTFLKKKRKKKQQYGGERYKNLSENEKEKLLEHRMGCENTHYYNYKKVFQFRKFAS